MLITKYENKINIRWGVILVLLFSKFNACFYHFVNVLNGNQSFKLHVNSLGNFNSMVENIADISKVICIQFKIH